MAILHARNGRCCISSCNFFVSITATELYAISCHSYVKYIIIKQDEIKLNKKQKKDKKKSCFICNTGLHNSDFKHRIQFKSGVFLTRAPCCSGE